MLVLDLVVSVITITVISTGAFMALLVNYFKSPHEFMDMANQSFLPTDKDALRLRFEALPERIDFMVLSRERASVEEFEFMLAVVDQPYDDLPQNVEFICPAVQLDRDSSDDLEHPDDHSDLILSPISCSGNGLRRPFLRHSTNRFWKGGKTVDIIGWGTHDMGDTRVVTRWYLGGEIEKPNIRAYSATHAPIKYSIESPGENYCLQWGSEMMGSQDILAQEGLYLTTWNPNREKVCDDLPNCNHFNVESVITKDMVESWDDSIECCMEGIEYLVPADGRHPHGKVSGVPLFEALYDKGENRGNSRPMYYVVRSFLNEIKLYRTNINQGIIEIDIVFSALSETSYEYYADPFHSKEAFYFFKRISAKKYFMMWFRYAGRSSGTQKPKRTILH